MRLHCNILLVKMKQMSPERRSNIGRGPRRGRDGDERLCSDCWHASSYLLPNDIYTAERSMLVSCSFCTGGRAISREGSEMHCTCFTTSKRASHSQILEPLHTTALARLQAPLWPERWLKSQLQMIILQNQTWTVLGFFSVWIQFIYGSWGLRFIWRS